jgi:hypothetical protein
VPVSPAAQESILVTIFSAHFYRSQLVILQISVVREIMPLDYLLLGERI